MIIGVVKSKTLKSGVIGEFWKIIRLNADMLTGKMEVTLGLYINQAAYNSGKSPVSMSKVYNLSVIPSDLTGDIREVVWAKIKAKAATVISIGLEGQSITPMAFDPDIDGATDVTV